MPSVYTIQGTSSRKSSNKQSSHRKRFKAAAKKCKGKPLGEFRRCMSRQLKK